MLRQRSLRFLDENYRQRGAGNHDIRGLRSIDACFEKLRLRTHVCLFTGHKLNSTCVIAQHTAVLRTAGVLRVPRGLNCCSVIPAHVLIQRRSKALSARDV